jgi:hypothetical protein
MPTFVITSTVIYAGLLLNRPRGGLSLGSRRATPVMRVPERRRCRSGARPCFSQMPRYSAPRESKTCPRNLTRPRVTTSAWKGAKGTQVARKSAWPILGA